MMVTIRASLKLLRRLRTKEAPRNEYYYVPGLFSLSYRDNEFSKGGLIVARIFMTGVCL